MILHCMKNKERWGQRNIEDDNWQKNLEFGDIWNK